MRFQVTRECTRGAVVKTEQRQMLRRLTLGDEQSLADALGGRGANTSLLDDKTRCLVRLAGLVALDAKDALLHASIDTALGAGASDEEIVEVVLAVAPIVGSSRMSSVLPRLSRALERD